MTTIRVLLTGGPLLLTGEDRIHEVPTLGHKVKVPRGNGTDHFRYSGESRDLNGSTLPVFHWCDRTKFAE
jgi:uncharacterized protein DUF5988